MPDPNKAKKEELIAELKREISQYRALLASAIKQEQIKRGLIKEEGDDLRAIAALFLQAEKTMFNLVKGAHISRPPHQGYWREFATYIHRFPELRDAWNEWIAFAKDKIRIQVTINEKIQKDTLALTALLDDLERAALSPTSGSFSEAISECMETLDEIYKGEVEIDLSISERDIANAIIALDRIIKELPHLEEFANAYVKFKKSHYYGMQAQVKQLQEVMRRLQRINAQRAFEDFKVKGDTTKLFTEGTRILHEIARLYGITF